jgi:hypothetical protein
MSDVSLQRIMVRQPHTQALLTFNFTSTQRTITILTTHDENHPLVKESGFDNDIGGPIRICTQHMRFPPCNQS